MRIELTEKFDIDAIRNMCIENGFYTCGNSEQYAAMFQFAKDYKAPTHFNVYHIANDIATHSTVGASKEIIENIMFLIARDCIVRHYEIIEG